MFCHLSSHFFLTNPSMKVFEFTGKKSKTKICKTGVSFILLFDFEEFEISNYPEIHYHFKSFKETVSTNKQT